MTKKKGLSHKTEVIEGDGSKNIPTGFTVAIVALQAEPKKEILNNLLSKSRLGTRLIFRQAGGFLRKQYGFLPKNCSPTNLVRQNMKTIDSSVLFVKKEEKKRNIFISSSILKVVRWKKGVKGDKTMRYVVRSEV